MGPCSPTRSKNHGYIRICIPGHPMMTKRGWGYEHRVVAYDAGLLDGLSDKRQVHHRNKDGFDNRLENLEVLTPSEHAKRHRAEFCKRGHLMEGNRYVRPDGEGSSCAICAQIRESSRADKERKYVLSPNRLFCRNGHPATPETTYIRPDTGGNMCRICRDESMERYLQRKALLRKERLVSSA